MADSNKLSPAVAEKYDLVGTGNAGVFILPERYARKTVNYSTMTLAEADGLVAKFADVKNPDGSTGFCYLKAKSSGKSGK